MKTILVVLPRCILCMASLPQVGFEPVVAGWCLGLTVSEF